MATAASKWDIRFDNHPLWRTVDELTQLVYEIKTSSNPEIAQSLIRLVRLCETLRQHRDAESKDLYTSTMLQNVHSTLTNYVLSQVQHYLQNPGGYESSLITAGENCDSVYDQLAIWPALTSKGNAIAAGQAAAQYVTASTKALKSLEASTQNTGSSVADLSDRVTSLGDDIEKYRERLTTLESEYSAQYTELHDNAASDYAELATTSKEQYNDLSSSTSTRLADSISKFEESAKEETETRITDAIDSLKNSVHSTVLNIEEAETTAGEKLGRIKTLTTETENLVSSFVRKAVAEDYQKNATNKSVAGWIWDILGFLVGAIPLGVVLGHFLAIDNTSETSTSITLSRIGISIAAVGVSALCFHRGSLNHKESRRAKRTDLRVRTVHQFIANLDPEVGKAVLEGMADRIYLQGILDTDDGQHDDSLLKQFVLRRTARQGQTSENEGDS